MLPDDVLNKIYKEDGTTAVLVIFEDGIAEDRTLDAIQTLRDITDENCKISGMSATNLDIKDICNSEVIIYVIIAVILCAIILGVALDSYAMPFILLGNIGISVLYNMGTNVVFHEISYITKSNKCGATARCNNGLWNIFCTIVTNIKKETESNNDKAMALAIADTLKICCRKLTYNNSRILSIMHNDLNTWKRYRFSYGKRCCIRCNFYSNNFTKLNISFR